MVLRGEGKDRRAASKRSTGGIGDETGSCGGEASTAFTVKAGGSCGSGKGKHVKA